MTERLVSGDDEIARCVIFPRHFQGAAHTDEVLFAFGQSDADGASHESGVLRRLAPLDDDVHRIGCKIAGIQNDRASLDVDAPKRRFYCGFRSASARDVAISGDQFEVVLTLDGEGGEDAHIDIAVRVTATGRSERNTIKSEVGLVLAEAFGPVREHICDCDAENSRHPLLLDPKCLVRGVPRLSSLQADLNLEFREE